MLCQYFLVSGRVQGVFYRASTVEQARRLGLGGWVRNRSDGKVELLACGEQAALQALEAWLWQGPAQAQVQSVISEGREPQSLTVFDVRH